MNRKCVSIIIVIILLVLNIFVFFVGVHFKTLPLEEPPITGCVDKETAIKIVQLLYEKQCGIFLDDERLFEIIDRPENNEYEVKLRNYEVEKYNKGVLDGEGVCINKDNGQIWWSVVTIVDIAHSYYGRMEEME